MLSRLCWPEGLGSTGDSGEGMGIGGSSGSTRVLLHTGKSPLVCPVGPRLHAFSLAGKPAA